MTTKSDKPTLGRLQVRHLTTPAQNRPARRGFRGRYRFYLQQLLWRAIVGGAALDKRVGEALLAALLLLLSAPLLVGLLLARRIEGERRWGRYGVPFTLWRLRGGGRWPALWNVLRGELALFGPPPLPLSEADPYAPALRRRLRLRPGLLTVGAPVLTRYGAYMTARSPLAALGHLLYAAAAVGLGWAGSERN